MAFSMQFESRLHGSREQVWEWISSLKGISTELKPFYRMTAPTGVNGLEDVRVIPGLRLFRSFVLLFGVFPVDASDLTLMRFERGHGFVEESPMFTMKLWRHERRIVETALPSSVILVDRLVFEPRLGRRLIGWFVRKAFEHRHAVLRRTFGAAPARE
jgi:ligand-binding SRPBCC domain-containing protein